MQKDHLHSHYNKSTPGRTLRDGEVKDAALSCTVEESVELASYLLGYGASLSKIPQHSLVQACLVDGVLPHSGGVRCVSKRAWGQ